MRLSPSTSERPWKEKLSRWFLEIAKWNKRIFAGEVSDFPPGAYRGAEPMHAMMLQEGRPIYPYTREVLGDDLAPGTEISNDELTLRWLTYVKYGRTLPELLSERKAGSWDAAKKLLRVQELSERVAFNKLRPTDRSLLADKNYKRAHRVLIQMGISFGLLQLTESELAEFFDEYCPCGKHRPENLKKLRQRVLNEMKRTPESKLPL